ncbi:MAG TPA: hypothetical protein VFL12_04325, partial [Thermoanaerobaculia bacterium]|nr:hypothetical protein [Thermoanaerobaculia bacterium]
MNGKRFAMAAAAVVLSTVAMAQDWRGHGRVEGNVKDPQGNPFEGATVSLRWTDGKGPDVKT